MRKYFNLKNSAPTLFGFGIGCMISDNVWFRLVGAICLSISYGVTMREMWKIKPDTLKEVDRKIIDAAEIMSKSFKNVYDNIKATTTNIKHLDHILTQHEQALRRIDVRHNAEEQKLERVSRIIKGQVNRSKADVARDQSGKISTKKVDQPQKTDIVDSK